MILGFPVSRNSESSPLLNSTIVSAKLFTNVRLLVSQTKIADDAWHRVFMGRYADEQQAQDVANLARSDFKLNAVVVSKTN